MTGTRAALYSPPMLALAVELARYPLDPASTSVAEIRSRTCGSTLRLACNVDDGGAITQLGLQVSACAVGQASAAIFASQAVGRDAADLEQAAQGIEDWLAGKGPQPDWPRFEMLEPALPHTGRHEAILLPWRAAREALSKAPAPR